MATKRSKRQASLACFKKWQSTYKREHQSLSWLRCDVDSCDKSIVDLLWCEVCRQHDDSIRGMKNYSAAWVNGTDNHKTSCIVDHATSSQHKAAMNRFRLKQAKANAVPLATFSPIVHSLCTLDENSRKRLRKL